VRISCSESPWALKGQPGMRSLQCRTFDMGLLSEWGQWYGVGVFVSMTMLRGGEQQIPGRE
jgi:hypothetical protein